MYSYIPCGFQGVGQPCCVKVSPYVFPIIFRVFTDYPWFARSESHFGHAQEHGIYAPFEMFPRFVRTIWSHRPCPLPIGGGMVAWRLPDMLGGFRSFEGRSHLRISSIRTKPSLQPTIWILLYKMVLHFNSKLGMSHPPSFFSR